MRKLFYHWLISLGMFGLIIILASCGGSSTGSTTGTPGNGSTPSGDTTSTVSFTASGGLTGSYTLNAGESSQLLTTSKNKQLTINAVGGGLSANIVVLPYTGPGSYTLSNKYFADNSQKETIDFQKGQKVWGGYIRLSPSWTCSLTIASDTATTLTVSGQVYTNFRKIKGSFSCSQVLSALNTDPPVNLSNGQFDVFAQTVTGS
jgi:hypothetical protein